MKSGLVYISVKTVCLLQSSDKDSVNFVQQWVTMAAMSYSGCSGLQMVTVGYSCYAGLQWLQWVTVGYTDYSGLQWLSGLQ